MDKKKLERLERKVTRRDAQQGVRNTKKAKQENPFVLNAEVGLYKPGHGTTQLGKIIEVGKYLLTVKWQDNSTEQFGKRGKSFYGKVDAAGELVPPKNDPMWGGDEDPHLTIASDEVKQAIAAKRADKEKRDQERKTERERIEADPAYQKRQADLNRYSEMLSGFGVNIENGWNDQADFRIELDGIKPDRMEKLVLAIREALK
jgi:hypothetical protein